MIFRLSKYGLGWGEALQTIIITTDRIPKLPTGISYFCPSFRAYIVHFDLKTFLSGYCRNSENIGSLKASEKMNHKIEKFRDFR